jgi:hypothetical protein
MINRIIETANELLGVRRRYRVTYDRGRREANGFRFRRAAQTWARENCRPGDWVVDEPNAIDLRILETQARGTYRADGIRTHYVGSR